MENKYKKLICILSVIALIGLIVIAGKNIISQHTNIIDDVTPLTNGDPVSASFYLFNPKAYKATFTSVSPNLCEYIGEGYVYYGRDVLNSPSDVGLLVAQEADYSGKVPEGKAIEWGSVFKRSKKIIVVGLLIDAPEPVAPAEDIPDETEEIVIDEEVIIDEEIVDEEQEEIIPEEPKAKDSVTDFGAVGDGTTDDTNAIKEAIAANVGGSLYIPSGTYMISKAISIPSNIEIHGDGESSVIIAAPGFGAGKDLLNCKDSHDVVLSNIALSGDSNSNTRALGHSDKDGIHLLDLWRDYNIRVDSCYFIDNINVAVRLIGGVSNISFDNCKFIRVDCGIQAPGSGSIDELKITNCLFDGHEYSEPITLYGTGSYSNITVSGNIIKNKTYGQSIYFESGKSLTITQNKLYDNSVGIVVNNASDVTISDNEIDFEATKKLSTGAGMKITNCSDVVVTNNYISNTHLQGMRIESCSNIDINNNHITDCGYCGNEFHIVHLKGTMENFSFTQNTITRTDNSLSKYTLYAECNGTVNISNNIFENGRVYLWKTSSNVRMENNKVPVFDAGKSNVVIN